MYFNDLAGSLSGVETVLIFLLQKCNLRMKNLPLDTIATFQVFRPFLLLLKFESTYVYMSVCE